MYSLTLSTSIDNIEELDNRVRGIEPNFVGLSKDDNGVVTAWFSEEPTDLTTFTTHVNAQVSYEMTKNTVSAAIQFGQQLTTEFASENILMGITQSGKTKFIADTLKDVFYYLSCGSLYEADNTASQLEITEEMSPFLTTARITTFRNKIRAYLGLPLL